MSAPHVEHLSDTDRLERVPSAPGSCPSGQAPSDLAGSAAAIPSRGPSPSRPVLRWHGGKWMLAPWIIRHFPAHRIYVEPFGGAASVLLRKPRSYAEVYNDLDDDVVNLFRVLRSERAPELLAALRDTPFARAEFRAAYEFASDPVEEARRLIIRSFMGFGSDGMNRAVTTGFRGNANRNCTVPAHDWANYPDALPAIVERLRGVVVEHRDAAVLMDQHDSPETLHYLDPPYLPETRSKKHRGGSRPLGGVYRHELTDEGHRRLLDAVQDLRGMVVLSGYPAPSYDAALPDWTRVECEALADGARPRTEVLWINPRAAERLGRFGPVGPAWSQGCLLGAASAGEGRRPETGTGSAREHATPTGGTP